MSCAIFISKKVKLFIVSALNIGCFIFFSNCSAQSKFGIENYNYLGLPGPGAVVPMIHFETKQNWYAELRYNYEESQTLSFFAGKIFENDKKFSWKIIPMAGFSAGNFTGISIGFDAEASYNAFYISSQSQYSRAAKKANANFFFSWSELGFNISKHLYGGVAMQFTQEVACRSFEPGLVAGIEVKNFSFPVYVFNPLTQGCYVVIGINYSCQFSGRKK